MNASTVGAVTSDQILAVAKALVQAPADVPTTEDPLLRRAAMLIQDEFDEFYLDLIRRAREANEDDPLRSTTELMLARYISSRYSRLIAMESGPPYRYSEAAADLGTAERRALGALRKAGGPLKFKEVIEQGNLTSAAARYSLSELSCLDLIDTNWEGDSFAARKLD